MSSRPAGAGSGHRCELTVTGPLAGSVLETMQSRFDAMATRHPDRTVVVARSVDQAAVRALMVMLWDSGHEVLGDVDSPTSDRDGRPSGSVPDQIRPSSRAAATASCREATPSLRYRLLL